MEHVDAIGCLSQRSRIERLQTIADGWTRAQVGRIPGDGPTLTPALIVLGEGGRELVRDLQFSGAGPRGTIDGLIPLQGIIRILREGDVTAAALIAPRSADEVALQIADLDHEQSLTARIIRPEHGAATIDKWDFAPFRGPLRLRQILRSVRASASLAAPGNRMTGVSGTPSPFLKPAAEARPARPSRDAIPAGRRSQVHELREQLGQPAPAAPSWLQ